MTRSRWWILGGAILAVLILLLGWLFLISPRFEEAAQLQQQADDTETQNLLLAARIEQLKQLAADLPAKQAEYDALRVQIPGTPQLPELLRQLSAIAEETGIDLVSVAPATPVPLVLPVESAAPAPADSATVNPDETAAPSPAAPAPPATNVLEIDLTVSAVGEFSNMTLFISRLETLPRAFLTTGYTLNRGGEGAAGTTFGGNPLTLTLQGKVFMIPQLPDVLPALSESAAPDASTAPGESGVPGESVVPGESGVPGESTAPDASVTPDVSSSVTPTPTPSPATS